MISWWQHMSWSHAAIVAILCLFALANLGAVVGAMLGFNDRPVPPRRHRKRQPKQWLRAWPREQHRSYFSDCRRVPEDQQ